MHVGAFAKLADAHINAAAGGGKKVYRFESTCSSKRFYVVRRSDGFSAFFLFLFVSNMPARDFALPVY